MSYGVPHQYRECLAILHQRWDTIEWYLRGPPALNHAKQIRGMFWERLVSLLETDEGVWHSGSEMDPYQRMPSTPYPNEALASAFPSHADHENLCLCRNCLRITCPAPVTLLESNKGVWHPQTEMDIRISKP